MKTSSISILSLADCDIGVNGISTLAKFIPDIAAMNFLDVSKNRIGADGARALLQAIPSSKLQTIVIGMKDPISITVGGSDAVAAMTALDYSNQDIGPAELMMISSLIIPFSATIRLLNISANKCFGTKFGRHATPGESEYTEEGWTAICDAIKGTQIETLVLSDIGLNPAGLTIFSNAMPAIASLNMITVSSTGSEYDSRNEGSGPRTYT
jgi:hypothetical protein